VVPEIVGLMLNAMPALDPLQMELEAGLAIGAVGD
jgi:hypothetical protein